MMVSSPRITSIRREERPSHRRDYADLLTGPTDLKQAKSESTRPTSAYSRARHIERNADIGISLELGEDPEHLDHHPSGGRGGVERLGG
jgi:hypothetical protein